MQKVIRTDSIAVPSRPDKPTSFWRITDVLKPTDIYPSRTITTPILLKARKGIDTNLESAFRVSLLRVATPGTVLVRNIIKRAKKPLPEVEAAVETGLLFPFVNGQSIQRWGYKTAGLYIVPHTAQTGMKPISEEDMRRRYRLSYSFLSNFKKELLDRPLHKRWGKSHPFYSLYNIGPYTFAPYRVGWKRSTKNFAATVLGKFVVPLLGERPVVANGDVMSVICQSEDEAYFICGLLNSTGVRDRINRSITTKAHRDIISVVDIPKYDLKDGQHIKVSELSKLCHRKVSQGIIDIQDIETQLDRVVEKVLGFSSNDN